MTESKTVKINLKTVVEDFIFAYADKDKDAITELEGSFKRDYNNQSDNIKSGIIKYLLGNKNVIDNKKLLKFFNSFEK